jgi:hypothetical protein
VVTYRKLEAIVGDGKGFMYRYVTVAFLFSVSRRPVLKWLDFY